MSPQPNPLLPAGAVATVDRLLGRLRTDVCQVKRRGSARDAGGAPAANDYGVVATVACRVTTPGRVASERVAGGRFAPDADFEILVPRDTDVRPDDRIAVNGRTMEVVYAATAASHAFQLSVLAKASG